MSIKALSWLVDFEMAQKSVPDCVILLLGIQACVCVCVYRWNTNLQTWKMTDVQAFRSRFKMARCDVIWPLDVVVLHCVSTATNRLPAHRQSSIVASTEAQLSKKEYNTTITVLWTVWVLYIILQERAGEQHTQRMCDITFYARCHGATSSVHTEICFFLKSNMLNIAQ